MQPSKNNILHFIYRATQYFQIPDFQRPYTWDTPIVEAFLGDLEHVKKSARNHYFGTIVYVPEADHFTVIDGQQRLTTTLLMLVAIYHILREHSDKSDIRAEQIRDQYLYDKYGAPNHERKILLRTITEDNEVFKKIFDNTALLPDEQVNRQKKAYDQFRSYFMQRDHLETYLHALEMFEVITVAIDQNDDNPQLIFESINSTGAPLSSGDKIRNYSLMLKSEAARRHVFDRYWKQIERSLTRRDGNTQIDGITGFYRHFLQCKAAESFAEAETYSRFKKSFDSSIGQEHAIDRLDHYYTDLLPFLNAYLFIRYSEDTDGKFAKFIEYNDRFQYLDFAPRISFLMDVLVEYLQNKITVSEVAGIFKALEVFIVRRLMCNMGTAGMNKAIPSWFKRLQQFRRKHPDNALDDIFRRILLDGRGRTRVFPNDAEVRGAVGNYPMGTYVTRYLYYVLSIIEDSLQPNESRRLSQILKGEIKLTLEHIMPQTLSAVWKRELGENSENIHETWLNRLANLTLTGYNSTYSNKGFAEKKSSESGFSNSPLNINRHIAGYEAWNEEALKKREAWLVERILKAWPMPTSSVLAETENKIGRHVIGDDVELSRTNPTCIEICGSVFTVSTWRQVAEVCCNQLYQLDSSLFETFSTDDAFISLKGGQLVSDSPQRLGRAAEIAPGIYVEVNLSARRIRDLLLIMAEKFQLEDDIFYELESDRSPDEDKNLTPLQKCRLAFWTRFKSFSESNGLADLREPTSRHYFAIYSGLPKCYLALCIFSQNNYVRCELYIPQSKELFHHLDHWRTVIEQELQSQLDWQSLPNKNASRIALVFNDNGNFRLDDETTWQPVIEWLNTTAQKFAKVFKNHADAFNG